MATAMPFGLITHRGTPARDSRALVHTPSLTTVVQVAVLVLLPVPWALRWVASGLALAPLWWLRLTPAHCYRRLATKVPVWVPAWMEQGVVLALRSALQERV